jgi:membrane protein YqaA with SNARE-associated domain
MLSWWMGYGAHHAIDKVRSRKANQSPANDSMSDRMHLRALQWLEKLGPKACILSWLPGVGDPLCAVAGWLKMPLAACTFYMAIGKFLRYLLMTSLLLWVF